MCAHLENKDGVSCPQCETSRDLRLKIHGRSFDKNRLGKQALSLATVFGAFPVRAETAERLICFTTKTLAFPKGSVFAVLTSPGVPIYIGRGCSSYFLWVLAFSSPEPTILLTCGRDRELWPDPII